MRWNPISDYICILSGLYALIQPANRYFPELSRNDGFMDAAVARRPLDLRPLRGRTVAVVHGERDIETLRAELASLEAMLADLESGKIPHGLGNPFEDRDRQTVIRRRIERIKSTLRDSNAHRL
jgi:hypothetical protein